MSDVDPPPAPAMDYAGPQPPATNGQAVASLVLGLVSLVLMCVWYIALPCGILAIVFGVLGRGSAKRGAPRGGMATAGLILGILGVVIPLMLVLGVLALIGIGGPSILEEIQKAAQEAQQNAAP